MHRAGQPQVRPYDDSSKYIVSFIQLKIKKILQMKQKNNSHNGRGKPVVARNNAIKFIGKLKMKKTRKIFSVQILRYVCLRKRDINT